jgi:recombinational DNA repair protein (RecF pathway)
MVKLQVLGNNSKTVNNIKNLTWGKNDQRIKIYLPCNFEVNLMTHLGVNFKLQKCAAYQDLPTLQF